MTGEPAYAEALKVRETLRDRLAQPLQAVPVSAREMTDALVASDLLVGRAGSSTLAEASALGLPMVVIPYPHASAHQVANARALAEAGAARIVADEDFDAAALECRVDLLFDDAQLATMRAAARSFGRPGAAAAVAELVLALAERTKLPAAAAIDRSRGPRRDRSGHRNGAHGRGLRPDRHGHPAPHRRQDLAPRATRALHDDARRRSGRPLCRGPQPVRAARPVRFARSRELPYFILGRGSDLVISDAGVRGLVIYNRAQQHHFDGDRLIADSGLPMARAATLGKQEGLSGLEFGLAIPGTVGGAVWANAGAHESDVRAVLVEASVMRSDGSEQTLDRDGLELGPIATACSSTRRSVRPRS